MIAFRVFRNDSEVCLAGVEGLGVMSAIVTSAKRARQFSESGQYDESLDLTIGCLHTDTQENRTWPTQRLTVGDRITIQIEDAEMITPPAETRVYTEEFKLEATKQKIREMAKSLGWQLIETQNQDVNDPLL